MARIKILVDKDETVEEVEESLYKALDFHRSGNAHNEGFIDPAMIDTHDKLIDAHKKIFSDMMTEIFHELDKEYGNDNQ